MDISTIKPQAVMIIPIESFNQLLEKVSSMEIILSDLRSKRHSILPGEADPLKEEGYYFGDEIRQLLGWSKPKWTNGSKNKLVVNGRHILEPDPNNARQYRTLRKDLHLYMKLHITHRFNEVLKQQP